ncbi:hypothetical protein GQ42DRAFT_31303 [Ramicandelaber brevisporus]|nr:hypothetical protein GQ42DRAFT_31303 [Ramicandelaber brevisporus]
MDKLGAVESHSWWTLCSYDSALSALLPTTAMSRLLLLRGGACGLLIQTPALQRLVVQATGSNHERGTMAASEEQQQVLIDELIGTARNVPAAAMNQFTQYMAGICGILDSNRPLRASSSSSSSSSSSPSVVTLADQQLYQLQLTAVFAAAYDVHTTCLEAQLEYQTAEVALKRIIDTLSSVCFGVRRRRRKQQKNTSENENDGQDIKETEDNSSPAAVIQRELREIGQRLVLRSARIAIAQGKSDAAKNHLTNLTKWIAP